MSNRKRRKWLLIQGNHKLGEGVYHWSLPAIATCPGKTNVCSSICYATSGHYQQSNVIRGLADNWKRAKQGDFAARMIYEIHQRQIKVVRIHASGDFYNKSYAKKWLRIIRSCPDAEFYAYTRSWRAAKMEKALESMAELPNMSLWYSADSEAFPSKTPSRVRIAFLQTKTPQEGAEADLLFRTVPLRVHKRTMGLPMICPVETPGGKAAGIGCSECKHCWS